MRASVSRLCCVLCSAILTSCSATYVATRVDPEQVQTTHPGVYYMLPRTEVLAVLSVAQAKERVGRLSGAVWNDCLEACAESAQQCNGAPEAGERISYELTSARLHSRAVADPRRLYRVNVDFSAFAAFNHVFKLTNEGVLSSSSSELENKAVEMAINTTKALAKIAVTASTMQLVPPIECSDFAKLVDLQKELDVAESRLTSELDSVLFSKPVPSGPAIEQLLNRHTSRLKELRSSERFRRLLADRAKTSESKPLGSYAVKLAPEDFKQVTSQPEDWNTIQSLDLEGFAGLDFKPADIGSKDDVLKYLASERVIVSVAPVIAFKFDCDSRPQTPDRAYLKACPDDLDRPIGFRYRIPSAAQAAIKKKGDETLGAARILVAQYGAISSMPAEVSGLKSKIALDLYEGTGSPRQVDVGATPQPTTLVGDALSPLQDELDRRKKAKEDAEKAAAAAEINELTKERDVLKLKKEIADLEAALGSED